MTLRLAGKVAVVTGAGQGIGRAVALHLAREGADVIVADLSQDKAARAAEEVQSFGRRSLAYAIDLAGVAQVGPLCEQVIATFGHVDILVNNAGITQTKPMLDLTPQDWDHVINVNQRGLFFCLQTFARQMIAQIPAGVRAADRSPRSYGKIVNIASVAGRSGRPLATHYAAAKTAVISITKSAALALARYNINVNAVAPGVVTTPMWNQIDRERGQLFGTQPGEALAALVETIPLKRAASPEDIAGAVAFFCLPESDYITGQTLNVDGGLEMD